MKVLALLAVLLVLAMIICVVVGIERAVHQRRTRPPAVKALKAEDEVSLVSVHLARLVDQLVNDDMVSCTMEPETKREAQELLARYYGRQ